MKLQTLRDDVSRSLRNLSPNTAVTYEDVAFLTGRSVKTITNHIKEGKLPSPVAHSPVCKRWQLVDVLPYIEQARRNAAE